MGGVSGFGLGLPQSRESAFGVVEVLIHWLDLPDYEDSWESAACIQEAFPDFHLEDKVDVLGRGIDRDRPTLAKVYVRKCKQGSRE